MLRYSEIKSAFEEYGIEAHEYNVELNDVDITTPFVVYTASDGDTFNADGINFFNLLNIGLAVIDATLNFRLQKMIEQILDKHDTSYDKSIAYNDESRLYSITYTFSVMDNSNGE